MSLALECPPGADEAPQRTSGGVVVASGRLDVPRVLPVKSLSPSSMAQWERCREQWYRERILKERKPANVAMTAGKAFAAVVSHYVHERLEGRATSELEIDDRLLTEYDQELTKAVPAEDEDPVAIREQVREPVRVYVADVLRKLRPVAAERYAHMRFADAEWLLGAYLDVETADEVVIDQKLKMSTSRHVSEADARKDVQAKTALLLRALERNPARKFQFHSVKMGSLSASGERIRIVDVEASEKALVLFKARAAAIARQIVDAAESGDFGYGPNGWWCSERWCAYWRSCAAGGLQ